MKPFALTSLISTGLLFAFVYPVVAAQTADETKQTPPTTTTSPVTASPAPADAPPPAKEAASTTAAAAPTDSASQSKSVIRVSKESMKRLRNIGFYPKNDKGQLVFCRKETPLGTRFSSETCMNADQLAMFLEGAEIQRQQLQSINCMGGLTCGGGK
jgi:hypothetical protein